MKKQVVLIVIIMLLVAVQIAQAASSDPGSSGDPVAAKSYVDAKSTEDRAYTDAQVSALNQKLKDCSKIVEELQANGGAGSGGYKFVVVELQAGQKLIVDESTEVIVRSGKCTAIGSANGGLSNLTQAKDIATGASIPLNNHLLIPRTDGRGVKATTMSYVLVKGAYRIE